ncbi:hypothetical protein NZK32_05060 [Cyanobium sp. FGCU-52]|nr:hypothetical protein [Cyanobium sp. FGCU52]
MALRRHRLPRFWLALTLGSVLGAMGLVYWWERQLPDRIRTAAAAGRLDDCLRLSEQLAALSWLPGRASGEEAECRRQRAAQLWALGQKRESLKLQRRLVNSPVARADDRRRLRTWEQSLRATALNRFQGGDLNGALQALVPLADDPRGENRLLAEDLKQNWQRNRQQLERARQLARRARWWEALDALNRLDHPWWKKQATADRQRVQEGIARLSSKDHEHNSHGSLPHEVPVDQLDAAVQKHLAIGLDEWQAFEKACRDLGGRVEEAGPESACRR